MGNGHMDWGALDIFLCPLFLGLQAFEILASSDPKAFAAVTLGEELFIEGPTSPRCTCPLVLGLCG
uniref:Uncharacterized protein n=1 Tax=Bionectria ochroleuca TaxID=29856 RepID=A0A8H7K8U2_BIOOC